MKANTMMDQLEELNLYTLSPRVYIFRPKSCIQSDKLMIGRTRPSVAFADRYV